MIQVGRLLRTMLVGQGGAAGAPSSARAGDLRAADLRIDRGCRSRARAVEQARRTRSGRPRAAPGSRRSPSAAECRRRGGPPAAAYSLDPARLSQGRGVGRERRRTMASFPGSYASHVAVILVAIAVIGGLLLTRPAFLFPQDPLSTDAPPPATARAAPVEIGPSAPATPEPQRAEPAALIAREPAPPPRSVRQPPPVEQGRPGAVGATPLDGRTTRVDPSRRRVEFGAPCRNSGHRRHRRRPRATPSAEPRRFSRRDSQRKRRGLSIRSSRRIRSTSRGRAT